MFWRLCFWSQGPTQECSKDPQGQSQAGPQGPKLRVCACKSAHQWIGRTHIRAHRPETALPQTTQEPKGPPKAPESTQEPPQHAQTCTEGVVPATSATTLRHTSPGLLRRSRAQHFDGGGGVRAQRVLDKSLIRPAGRSGKLRVPNKHTPSIQYCFASLGSPSLRDVDKVPYPNLEGFSEV